MDRNQFDEEDVIGFDALYLSAMKCRHGVLWKDSVAAYYHRAAERTGRLSDALHSGKYKAMPPKHFVVTSPKRREIASIAFRDRVYQRSLNDNLVYPIMTNGFIYDNYACQTGKGTDHARERLKAFLRKHYRKHGREGYVAQFDIRGYYPNMRHSIVENMFREKLPEWAYRRVERILHEQYGGETGYNPGSQLIQIAGISLLNGLDHMIKERLRVKLYIRYMDDLILIHESREFLEKCRETVEAELRKMGFETNPKKTRIYDLREGIMFLGFRFWLTESGKVILTADPKKIKAAKKKYRRLVAKARRGECTRESLELSWATWMNHLSKGNSYRLRRELNQFYDALWKDGEDYENQEEKHNACGTGEDRERAGAGGSQQGEH